MRLGIITMATLLLFAVVACARAVVKKLEVEFGSSLKIENTNAIIRSETLWPMTDGEHFGEPSLPLRWHVYASDIDASGAITVGGERVATVADLRRWTEDAALVSFGCSLLGVLAAIGVHGLIHRVQLRRYLARQRRGGGGPYRDFSG